METRLKFTHDFDIGDCVVLKSNQGTKRENNAYRVIKVLVDLPSTICIKSEEETKDYTIKYQLEAVNGIVNSMRIENEDNLILVIMEM